jgi:hypothetical protein
MESMSIVIDSIQCQNTRHAKTYSLRPKIVDIIALDTRIKER